MSTASVQLCFTFDGRALAGEAGDTLAAALLRNGIHRVGSSVNLGRPRGIEAGLVDIEGPDGEPMRSPLDVELRAGLVARGLAGRGRLSPDPDTARYDTMHAHADVLVVGAGPAGRAAAAAVTGRVILLDDQPPGDEPAQVRYLSRTTAFGLYDDGYVLALERRVDQPSRQRIWRIRAREVVLATGAHERPIVFDDNDRPGIMLAGTALRMWQRHGVLAGREIVVFTADDSAYEVADVLTAAGAHVRPVLDARLGQVVTGTSGQERVESVTTGTGERIACDLLLVSGGWNPAVQLWSQAGGKTAWNGSAFVPTGDLPGVTVVGAAAGPGSRDGDLPAGPPPAGGPAATPVWRVPGDPARQFVDLTRDATVADIARAVGAGMRSVEHVKRYTTIGTGPDQGRPSGVLACAITAELLDVPVAGLGTTTYRPPYVPVQFAALAGRNRGALLDPARHTALHAWHEARGAVFEDVGQWKRPRYYPRPGEDMTAAVLRECAAARTSVGILDGSTLGKIDVQGADAGRFLDLVYTNMISTLKPGTARYGVMCGVDGMVVDDGTVLRLGGGEHGDRFLAYTTTGGAASVLAWMEEWLQTEWPELRVRLTSQTEHWATFPVVGPRSREVIAAIAPDLDVTAAAFPFMAWRDTTIAGVPVRIARISFSGELAYEVNVDAWHAVAVWEALLAAGEPYDITPYGTETMHVLRAEKGYPIVGQDTDGTVTPHDLGLAWAVSRKKPDFLGKRSFARAANLDPQRKQLVGLLPVDRALLLPEGSQIVAHPELPPPPVPMLGHVTSSYRSAELGRTFALALVEGGRERIGATVYVPVGGVLVAAEVTSSVLVDPEGARRDGPAEFTAPAPVTPAQLRRTVPVPAGRFAGLPDGVQVLTEPFVAMMSVRGSGPDAERGRWQENEAGDTSIRLGPDEWLVANPYITAGELAARVGGVDVSAQFTTFRLRGEHAADVVRSACPLDIHPGVFPPGSAAQTTFGKAGTILLAGTDGFRLVVRASFAGYVADRIVDAAVEYAAPSG